MRFPVCVSSFVLATLLAASPLAAQDTRRAGVTMGHPGSIGVIWHVSETVSVRPDLQVSYISSDSDLDGSPLGTSHGWTFNPAVSVLFYLPRWERLRPYVSPRFAFSRSTSTFESAGVENRSRNHTYAGSAAFGGEYELSDRFGLFAEAGLGFTRTTGSSIQSGVKTRGTQWSTRTGVGAIVYF